MNRRELLRASSLVPVAILAGGSLVGCASGEVPQFVAAIQAIGQEAALIMPQLQSAGLSGANATTAQTVISEIMSAASSIGNAATATQGQSTLVQIEGYVNALAPLALPFASLIPGGAALGLIVAALPAIELAVNLTVSLLSAQAKQLAATAPAPTASAMVARAAAPPSPQDYLNELLQRAAAR